jgi:hypothetical protein
MEVIMNFDRIPASPRTRAAYARGVALPVVLLLMVFGWLAYIVLPVDQLPPTEPGAQQGRAVASPTHPERTTVTAADAS